MNEEATDRTNAKVGHVFENKHSTQYVKETPESEVVGVEMMYECVICRYQNVNVMNVENVCIL